MGVTFRRFLWWAWLFAAVLAAAVLPDEQHGSFGNKEGTFSPLVDDTLTISATALLPTVSLIAVLTDATSALGQNVWLTFNQTWYPRDKLQLLVFDMRTSPDEGNAASPPDDFDLPLAAREYNNRDGRSKLKLCGGRPCNAKYYLGTRDLAAVPHTAVDLFQLAAGEVVMHLDPSAFYKSGYVLSMVRLLRSVGATVAETGAMVIVTQHLQLKVGRDTSLRYWWAASDGRGGGVVKGGGDSTSILLGPPFAGIALYYKALLVLGSTAGADASAASPCEALAPWSASEGEGEGEGDSDSGNSTDSDSSARASAALVYALGPDRAAACERTLAARARQCRWPRTAWPLREVSGERGRPRGPSRSVSG
jgi:hypothetical protein